MNFQVAGDMDAGCPYTFSFGVKNRKNKQDVAPAIGIECKWNGAEYVLADLFDSDTSSAPMHEYHGVGDAAPLKICPLEFKEKKMMLLLPVWFVSATRLDSMMIATVSMFY